MWLHIDLGDIIRKSVGSGCSLYYDKATAGAMRLIFKEILQRFVSSDSSNSIVGSYRCIETNKTELKDCRSTTSVSSSSSSRRRRNSRVGSIASHRPRVVLFVFVIQMSVVTAVFTLRRKPTQKRNKQIEFLLTQALHLSLNQGINVSLKRIPRAVYPKFVQC